MQGKFLTYYTITLTPQKTLLFCDLGRRKQIKYGGQKEKNLKERKEKVRKIRVG